MKARADAACRVLLIEEGWSATVVLARALERAGCAVTVLTATGGQARHRRRSVWWRSAPRPTSPAFLPEVARVVAEVGADRIVPLTEPVMARLWAPDALAAPWSARVFPTTTARQRALLASKHRLIEHLGARGCAVPAQVPLPHGADLDAIARALGWPLVVKGATGAAGSAVEIVDDRPGFARAAMRAWRTGGAWVAQAFVPGSTCLVGGLFVDGAPLRVYAAEKLAQHPPRTGPAIRVRSIDEPALLAAGLQVFRELGWTGLASADLVRAPDGRGVVLEVNPRPWGSIAAAASAGVELFVPFAEVLAGGVPRAELAFVAGDVCRIFPRYLLAPATRSLRGAVEALVDLLGEQGQDWRDPGFALHLLRRLG